MLAVSWTHIVVLIGYVIITSAGSDVEDDNNVLPKTETIRNQLATKMNCRENERRHFTFESVTKLGMEVDQQILARAEATLQCLGEDTLGSFGSEALKYRVKITNLDMEEEYPKTHQSTQRSDSKTAGNFKSFEDDDMDSSSYAHSYSYPFEFVQRADGSIPEVRFNLDDTNSKIRNFKRHLVDAFATQLDVQPSSTHTTTENSFMGQHLSHYTITSRSDSEVVVDKTVTTNDVLKFSSIGDSNAINNKKKMDLKARQTQVFRNGEIVSSIGRSAVLLFLEKLDSANPDSLGERKDNGDNKPFFTAISEYKITFPTRRRRSVDDDSVEETFDGPYIAASRSAEKDDSDLEEKLLQLRNSIGNAEQFLLDTVNNRGNSDEKLRSVFEAVQQEVRLGLDQETKSVAEDVRRIVTKEAVEKLLQENSRKGADMLQLLAKAGGSEAEEVLFNFVKDAQIDHQLKERMINYLSDIPNPSSKILRQVISRMVTMCKSHDCHSVGSLALSASNMAVRSAEDKNVVAETLVYLLEHRALKYSESSDNFLILDLLEAIGNLGNEKVVDSVLRISAASENRLDVQIASIHALRYLLTTDKVQKWLDKRIDSRSGDVIQAIAGALRDQINKQETDRDETSWPRNGFNDIDAKLLKGLLSSAPEFERAVTDIKRYFLKKTSLPENLLRDMAEPTARSQRSKRLTLDDVLQGIGCHEWTEDEKYYQIQNKSVFASDRQTYNKRKSCLITKEFGNERLAKCELYAGAFIGVKWPSNTPEYKLFTKVVLGITVFGYSFEIGGFYFYLRNANSTGYIRALGQTYRKFDNDYCINNTLSYQKEIVLPIVAIPMYGLKLALQVHVTPEFELSTYCTKDLDFVLKPKIKLRVAGDASASLVIIKGAIALAANFNYYVKLIFAPVPDMCLKGKHGFDPMTIGLEPYYQYYRLFGGGWSDRKVWSPSFLNWELAKGNENPLFNDICILKSRKRSVTEFHNTIPASERQSPQIQLNSQMKKRRTPLEEQSFPKMMRMVNEMGTLHGITRDLTSNLRTKKML